MIRGCYIIKSKKSLYYYIGYSDVIDKRLNTHFRYFKSLNHTFLQPQANPLQLGGSSNIYLLSSRNHIPASPNPKDRDEGWYDAGSSATDLFKFYIDSCYKNKVDFDIEMGPICLYQNYFKAFLQKYPDYKLSVGEYFNFL